MIARDIAYVRFSAPDLDAMAAFLADFGLSTALVDETLYASGLGGAPFVHATVKGEPGFAGLAFTVSEEGLENIARENGAPIEQSDGPGGGRLVRLIDPDGNRVEAIAGWSEGEGGPVPTADGWNDARTKVRVRTAKRVAAGAAHVVRLGHCVLNVADFRASEAWYKRQFGLITSDEIQVQPGQAIGAFLRCDRGAELTDHHTLFLVAGRQVGFNHAAFEVLDADDLFVGHELLQRQGRAPHWGIGRHVLGSQIFDYWKDPWGHVLEHWTDGDLLNAEDTPRVASLQDLLSVQWGHAHPHAQ